MTKVQCRCGAVAVEISAEPIVQFYCHCDDCQAVHGGAYWIKSNASNPLQAGELLEIAEGAPDSYV